MTVAAELSFGLAATMFLAGCSHRSTWMHDESHRIDEAMKAEKFSPRLAGASGTAIEAAVPVAPPPSQVGYSLQPLAEKKPRHSKRTSKAKSSRAKEEQSALGTTLPRPRDGP